MNVSGPVRITSLNPAPVSSAQAPKKGFGHRIKSAGQRMHLVDTPAPTPTDPYAEVPGLVSRLLGVCIGIAASQKKTPQTAFKATAVSQAQVSPAQVSPAQVSPAQVSPAQVSPAQMSPAQVSPAQVTPATKPSWYRRPFQGVANIFRRS